MKTTLEIPDGTYRQIKARAALNGQTIRAFFMDAIQEKLNDQRRKSAKGTGWRSVFGKADREEVHAVQKIMDEEFSRIDPEEWS